MPQVRAKGSEKHGHALRQKFLLPEIAYTFELTIERLQKMETEKLIEALRSMPLRKL
jgi:hypothetical protein